MPNTSLKAPFDLMIPEMIAPLPVPSTAGSFTISSDNADQSIIMINSTSAAYLYNPMEDGWVLLPSPALSGFGAGASGTYNKVGPSSTAQTGTGTTNAPLNATTLITNLTLLQDLGPHLAKYFKGFITSGTGAGKTFRIISNTTGTNSILYVQDDDTELPMTLDSTTNFVLYTGRFYVLSSGTLSGSSSFKYYDYALGTWSAGLSITNLPSSISQDTRLVSTSRHEQLIEDIKATSGSSTTIVASKSWGTNQFANFQVKITKGTGAGQIRTISSNTATTLTVSNAFSTAPDSTSKFSISGNEDFLYFIGNNSGVLMRYSISANTWTPLAPRGFNAGAGTSLHWIDNCSRVDWNDETNYKNGRYLYSFRGGVLPALDVYDISTNTWANDISYGVKNETFAGGCGYAYDGKNRIIIQTSITTNTPVRLIAYDIKAQSLVPIMTIMYPVATVIAGDRLSVLDFYDGVGTSIKMLYWLRHSGTEFFRSIIF
jgi:hypothetical protein